MVNTTSIMEQVTLICPVIAAWSGTAKIRRDSDLKAISGQMPPKALVSDGAKHLIDSKEISALVTIRKAVQRDLEKIGVPMCGGFLIHSKDVQKAMIVVDHGEKQFQATLDILVAELPRLYAEQEARFPGWAELLRPHQISGTEVRSRCSYSVAAFKLHEPTQPSAALAFRAAEGCVIHSLLESIAKEADRIRKASFIGVTQIGQRPMRAIRDMLGKLESFSFVDPRVYPSCQVAHGILATLPKKGEMSLNETAALDGLLAKLSDPGTVLEHGQAVLAMQDQQVTHSTTDQNPAAATVANATPAPRDSDVDETALLEEQHVEVDLAHVMPPAPPAPQQTCWSGNLVF